MVKSPVLNGFERLSSASSSASTVLRAPSVALSFNPSTIEGECEEKNDQHKRLHGKETCVLNDWGVYKGQFEVGKRNGKGKLEMQNGDRYDGEWTDDKMHGIGKYTFGDGGHVYNGSFKDGKEDGIGTLRFAFGDVYEGEWKDG